MAAFQAAFILFSCFSMLNGIRVVLNETVSF